MESGIVKRKRRNNRQLSSVSYHEKMDHDKDDTSREVVRSWIMSQGCMVSKAGSEHTGQMVPGCQLVSSCDAQTCRFMFTCVCGLAAG